MVIPPSAIKKVTLPLAPSIHRSCRCVEKAMPPAPLSCISRITAIEFILLESTQCPETVKRQATVPGTQNTHCRRKAARFFQNVHKRPCFLVHIVGNMHKKRSNAVRYSLSRCGRYLTSSASISAIFLLIFSRMNCTKFNSSSRLEILKMFSSRNEGAPELAKMRR